MFVVPVHIAFSHTLRVDNCAVLSGKVFRSPQTGKRGIITLLFFASKISCVSAPILCAGEGQTLKMISLVSFMQRRSIVITSNPYQFS